MFTKTPIKFDSPRSRTSYETGIREVKAKLANARPDAAQREAATIADGKRQILKKLGASGYRRCFGAEPPTTTTTKPATRPAATASSALAARVKSYSTGRTLHRYVCRQWLSPV